MQENCKHLADEEMFSHQLFARGCVNYQIVKFNIQENRNHDKQGATGGEEGGTSLSYTGPSQGFKP